MPPKDGNPISDHVQQRDAKHVPQAIAFRPAGNSPSSRHLTHIFLLCSSFSFTVSHYSRFFAPGQSLK